MSTSGVPVDPPDLRADLVFEGGGVKGIALAGAYRELSDRGYVAQCVAGTSAGAITAALVAVGYSGAEVEEIVLRQMHFPDFADPTFLDHFGRPGAVSEFLLRRGMHSGDFFVKWIRGLLEAKQKTRFGDLRDPHVADARRAYRLQVIASDLSGRCMLVLPRDAALLGIEEPDELEIAQAVRMSMSIPVFFDPVVAGGGHSAEGHVIVDGGLLSNYPIWLFDVPPGTTPAFPTFGLTLVAPGPQAPVLPARAPEAPIRDLGADVEFLKAIVETMMEAHDRIAIDEANYARTIPLPTLGVTTTDFDITAPQAQALFDAGKAATAKFLDTWSFAGYIERFRS